MHVRLLTHIFRTATTLDDLRLSCRNATPEFFKSLAKAVPVMNLRQLELSYTMTRYKYLSAFLDSCRQTLRHIELDKMPFARSTDG